MYPSPILTLRLESTTRSDFTMATGRAPKQWQLTKTETINSFENWRQNLVYIPSLDNNFAAFINHIIVSGGKSQLQIPLEVLLMILRRGKQTYCCTKNAHLDLMLWQVTHFCPVIPGNSIIKQSTSLKDIFLKKYSNISASSHLLQISWILQTFACNQTKSLRIIFSASLPFLRPSTCARLWHHRPWRGSEQRWKPNSLTWEYYCVTMVSTHPNSPPSACEIKIWNRASKQNSRIVEAWDLASDDLTQRRIVCFRRHQIHESLDW